MEDVAITRIPKSVFFHKGHGEMWDFWGFVADWWHARQRALDVLLLWPSCRDQARDLDHAHRAFKLHASTDEAWLALGTTEMDRQIMALR
jgi:hypothetical protein